MHAQFDQEPLLDMAIIAELQELDQGSGFFEELTTEFSLQNERLFEEIRRDAQDLNYEQLRFSVHTLKGSSLNLGAMRQAKIAIELEAACKRKDGPEINRRLPLLFEVGEQTVQALRSLL